MVQDCPRCGMASPPEARRCDCGYDFVSRQMEGSYLGEKDRTKASSPTGLEWAVCVLLPIVGIILGLVARSKGRREAGNMMLMVSGVVLVVGIVLRLLMMLPRP